MVFEYLATDNIYHDFLLELLTGFPAHELIKQWLLAGYMQAGSWHPTDTVRYCIL